MSKFLVTLFVMIMQNSSADWNDGELDKLWTGSCFQREKRSPGRLVRFRNAFTFLALEYHWPWFVQFQNLEVGLSVLTAIRLCCLSIYAVILQHAVWVKQDYFSQENKVSFVLVRKTASGRKGPRTLPCLLDCWFPWWIGIGFCLDTISTPLCSSRFRCWGGTRV